MKTSRQRTPEMNEIFVNSKKKRQQKKWIKLGLMFKYPPQQEDCF